MKVLLTDYLAALRERGELDAILPDLLSELGFNVISRPAIGVAQRGVDIAAVGLDADGVRKLFLFSVKAGDLTRREWSGPSVQALRPSLDEILDDYIPHHIPSEHRRLKIVICLVVGGVVQQAVRTQVTGYIQNRSTRRVSFQEWNGDKLSEMMLAGVLREKFLPKELQASFRKAVAMVDEPDVAYSHFAQLVAALVKQATDDKARLRAARQIYLCLWVLFVWARDVDNLDAPYRASELALLRVWELVKPFFGKRSKTGAGVVLVLHHLVQLHITITGLLLEGKIMPHVGRQHALSLAVRSFESADINLKLFEILGRLAICGQWMIWVGSYGGQTLSDDLVAALRRMVTKGFEMIRHNPALYLPLKDEQAIEVALFLVLAVQMGHAHQDIRRWLSEMVRRLHLTVLGHGKYPSTLTEYGDVIQHPKASTDEYREEVTAGSVLIPLLLAWAAAPNDQASIARLVELKNGALAHCTLQLWIPDTQSEAHLYASDDFHGAALADLPTSRDGQDLLDVLEKACKDNTAFNDLTAVQAGYFPLVLTACRHYRLPVPPQYWIAYLRPPADAKGATTTTGT